MERETKPTTQEERVENARLAAENRDMREALALKAIPGEDYRNELRAQVTREALAETKKLRAETAALVSVLRYILSDDANGFCRLTLGRRTLAEQALAPFTSASDGSGR